MKIFSQKNRAISVRAIKPEDALREEIRRDNERKIGDERRKLK